MFMSILRRVAGHARHNVVAYLALFVSLGGTGAYAAGHIGSAEIVDESIQSVDLKNGEVRRADVAANAIDGSRVGNNTLTPSDIQPESLSSGRIFGLDGSDVDDNGLKGEDIDEASLELPPVERLHWVGDEGEPPFLNGWRQYSNEASAHQDATWQHVAFMKDNSGIVHLSGLAAAGEIGKPIFMLPQEYCPWSYHTFAVASNGAFGRVTVTLATPGGCEVRLDNGSTDWVSLDGITFQESALDVASFPAGRRAAR